MPRYKLKAKCLFVDAKNFDDPKGPQRHPIEIPFAHILDKSGGSCLKLNDTAGFIARFIVLGVDTDLIPEIIYSEYGGTQSKPAKEKDTKSEADIKTAVNFVVNKLMPYLEPRTLDDCIRPYEPPGDHGVQQYGGKYTLDFSVNFVGTSVVKIIPPPPPPIIG